VIELKWTLSQLQKYRNKEFLIEETVRMDDIKQDEPTIREVSPILIKGRGDISSTKITFHLTIEGYLVLPCSRTLVDVNLPIHVETTETFLLLGSDFEPDEEVHRVNGDVIDVYPVIREILLLEIPMQVFCDDVTASGEEVAPQSGKGWEVISEPNQQEKIDPRLADLAKFFDNNKSSDL
jgi:uncharacterized protein